MLETDDELLTALLPIFEDGLTDEQIAALAIQLWKAKVISKDGLKLIEENHDKQKRVEFVNAIKVTSKVGWQYILSSYLATTDKPELAAIVERCFNKDANKHIVWILYSWNDLIAYESTVKEVIWMISHQKLEAEHWLLQFSSFVASAEVDSNLIETLMNLLQEKLSPFSSLSMSGFSAIDTSSFVGSDIQQSENIEAVVNASLIPLLTLMDTSLCHDSIVEIANALLISNYISQDAYKDIQSADTKQRFHMRTAAKFIEVLQLNAKNDWKDALLKAIQTSGQDSFAAIVKHHLFHSDTYLLHLLQNWPVLLQYKSIVLQAAQNYQISQGIDKSTPDWLLAIVHRLLTSDQKDTLQRFVRTLFGKNAPDPPAQKSNDKPEHLRQAIKKEYVPHSNEQTVKKESSQSATAFSSVPLEKYTNIAATGDCSSVEDTSTNGQRPQQNVPLPGFDGVQPRETGDYAKMEVDLSSASMPEDQRVFMDPSSLEGNGSTKKMAQEYLQQPVTLEQRSVQPTSADRNDLFDQLARERTTQQASPPNLSHIADAGSFQGQSSSVQSLSSDAANLQGTVQKDGLPRATPEICRSHHNVNIASTSEGQSDNFDQLARARTSQQTTPCDILHFVDASSNQDQLVQDKGPHQTTSHDLGHPTDAAKSLANQTDEEMQASPFPPVLVMERSETGILPAADEVSTLH